MARRKPQICRVDENTRDVTRELEALGYAVLQVGSPANRAPDLLVGCAAGNFLVELKHPKRAKKHPERLAQQQEWRAAWPGPVTVATSAAEVHAWIYAVKR